MPSPTRPAPPSATRATSSFRCASCRGKRTSRSRCALKLDYAVCEKLCVPVEAQGRVDAAAGAAAPTMPLCERPRRACRKLVTAAAAGLTAQRASDDKREAAGLRRSRRAHRRAGRTVRRGADAGMGVAHPQAGARRAARPRSISASSSTGCRPASIPRAPFELTFTIVARRPARPRSRLISTNPPAGAILRVQNPTNATQEDTHAHQGRR